MSQPVTAVAQIAQMIEIRDEQKRKLGAARYSAILDPLRELLRSHPLSPEAVPIVARESLALGFDPALLIAAYVEESGL